MHPTVNILMYHQVGDFPQRPPAHRSTYCHYPRFRVQMAWLANLGYNVIGLDQALAGLRGEAPIPPRAVVLTFDDGYENFYEYAWPELARHGFPAMVYALSGWLGRTSDWFAADGRATPPLMSAGRLRELRRAGVDIGSHGIAHTKLAQVDLDTARRELTDSKAALEDSLGEEIRHFCYPYGSHNPAVVEAAREAGYATAVTCVRAPARPGDDPLALPRKAISHGDNLLGFAWKLHLKNRPRAA